MSYLKWGRPLSIELDPSCFRLRMVCRLCHLPPPLGRTEEHENTAVDHSQNLKWQSNTSTFNKIWWGNIIIQCRNGLQISIDFSISGSFKAGRCLPQLRFEDFYRICKPNHFWSWGSMRKLAFWVKLGRIFYDKTPQYRLLDMQLKKCSRIIGQS